ncbi:hypothetical protein [Streptomyces sp. NPDC050263]|uniref:hypothetical protein n=1 Tax=Streptomyces sp. NPDC050263 TaxID=3155037 RepID=UPI00341A5759
MLQVDQIAIRIRASAPVAKVRRWTYSTLSTLLNASLVTALPGLFREHLGGF